MEDLNRIYLTVVKDDAFLSPYWSHKPVISSEAASYLDNAVTSLPAKRKLKMEIVISSDSIPERKRPLYTMAIHNYYANQLFSLKKERKRNLIKCVCMFLLGTADLLFLHSNAGHSLVYPIPAWTATVLEILGWVLVISSSVQYVMERHKLNMNYIRWYQLAKSRVIYQPLSTAAKKLVQEDKYEEGFRDKYFELLGRLKPNQSREEE